MTTVDACGCGVGVETTQPPSASNADSGRRVEYARGISLSLTAEVQPQCPSTQM
jgi:hypothetical protein